MVVDRQMHIFPADAAGLALTGPIAGDPMAGPTELAQLFDVDVEDLARGCPFVATDRLAGSSADRRLRPSRFRMRLTVAGETPASAPICAPVWRCLRKASTATQTAGGAWPGHES